MTKATPSTANTSTHPLVPRIEGRIQLIRGLRVMIDADLAQLYGVPTKALNHAVKRNAARFPPDVNSRWKLSRLTPHSQENLSRIEHLFC